MYIFTGLEAFSEPMDAPVLTNLLSNGNFVNTTGWSATGSSNAVSSNTLTNTGNGTIFYPSTFKGMIASIGKIYALTVKIRVTNAVCTKISYVCGTTGSPPNTWQAAPVQNTWYTKTLLITATRNTQYLVLYHYYADAATANGKVMEVQYVSCVDLTATFGAGNEPTEAAYESWIAQFNNKWFDSATPKSWVSYPYAYKVTMADAAIAGSQPICSHFSYLENAHIVGANGDFEKVGQDFYFNSNMELIEFKAWLATQTVILYYDDDFQAAANSQSREPIGKVIFYFEEPIGTVTFTRQDYLIDCKVLLETGADSALPYGSISANDLSIHLHNNNREFSYDNVLSPYYSVLKKGVKVEAYLGFIIDGVEEYKPMGVFWVNTISAPTNSIVASISCFDKLYNVCNAPMPALQLHASTTLKALIEETFIGVGLSAAEFHVDASLDIPLTYTAVVATKVREGLQKMAIAGMSVVYTDTAGIIQVKRMNVLRRPMYILTDATQLLSSVNTQNGEAIYNDVTVAYYFPLIKYTQDLLTLTNVTLQSGLTVLNEIVFDQRPVADVLYVIVSSASRDITIKITSYSANTVSLLFTNSGVACEADIRIVGNYATAKQMQATIATSGTAPADIKRLTIDNEFVQDYDTALVLADGLHTYVSDPYKAYELVIRGNPLYNLTNLIRIRDATHNILDVDVVISRLSYTYDGSLKCEVKAHKPAVPMTYVMVSPGLWVLYSYNYVEEEL